MLPLPPKKQNRRRLKMIEFKYLSYGVGLEKKEPSHKSFDTTYT